MEYKVPDVLGSMWLSDTCLPASCAHCDPTALAMGLLASLTSLCWEYRFTVVVFSHLPAEALIISNNG